MSDKPEEGHSSPLPHSAVAAPTSPSTSSSSEIVLWSSSPGNSSEDSDNERLEAAKSLLNFSSPSFSPILALKCKDLEALPLKPGAQQYLNLQQYSKTINSPSKTPRKNVAPLKQLQEALESKSKKKESNEPVASSSTSTTTPAPHYPMPGRRFLPHQMPVFRPRREHPNVLTLMKSTEGPLSVLNRVMTANSRVKLWTRNDKGFRGFLTGFVDAFDKHWNMALRDVDEQFVRRRVIKFPIIGDTIPEDEMEMEDCNNTKENRRKAISSTFIRLQNHLRQNEVKKGLNTFTPTQTNIITSIQKKSTASKAHLPPSKSKTVYVGDMDPLAICRAGLAKLSLGDDEDPGIIHQEKRDSFKSSRKETTPDIVECHQKSNVCGEPSASSIASRSPVLGSSILVPTIQQQTSSTSSTLLPPTRTSLKKKTLTVFNTPYEDNFGFMVVAQTKKYELVERHVGQMLLMGNDVVFIETSSGGC